jgi:hypothetical protein
VPRILAVDSTQHSTVVVCRWCGARFAATDRATALALAAPHPDLAHGTGKRITAEYRDRVTRIRRRVAGRDG